MRTTIELPDELLKRAKSRAALDGVSLKEFFVEAVEQKLTPPMKKVRRPPPSIGDPNGPKVPDVTPEQMEEAMIPIQPYVDEYLRSRR
jgi:hypothetical protein